MFVFVFSQIQNEIKRTRLLIQSDEKTLSEPIQNNQVFWTADKVLTIYLIVGLCFKIPTSLNFFKLTFCSALVCALVLNIQQGVYGEEFSGKIQLKGYININSLYKRK